MFETQDVSALLLRLYIHYCIYPKKFWGRKMFAHLKGVLDVHPNIPGIDNSVLMKRVLRIVFFVQ